MSSLSRRLESTILERFQNDRHKALRYIQAKCTEMAYKVDAKGGTTFWEHWRKILNAYRSCELSISYSIDMDQQMAFDLMEYERDHPKLFERQNP